MHREEYCQPEWYPNKDGRIRNRCKHRTEEDGWREQDDGARPPLIEPRLDLEPIEREPGVLQSGTIGIENLQLVCHVSCCFPCFISSGEVSAGGDDSGDAWSGCLDGCPVKWGEFRCICCARICARSEEEVDADGVTLPRGPHESRMTICIFRVNIYRGMMQRVEKRHNAR